MRLLMLAAMVLPLSACAHRAAPASRVAAERFLQIDGAAGRLRVSDGGTGEPAVVLVHGLGTDLEAWRAQLDHLRARGLRAVAYDQRGHGGSERPRDGVYTIAALAEDLDHVARALGLRRFVLVGHSMSGAVLTTYVGLHPDSVAGLVYVDAVGGFDAVPRDAVAQWLAKDASLDAAGLRTGYVEMLGPKAHPATRERVLASVARMDPAAFAPLRRSTGEVRAARAAFAAYRGPAVAIEAAGEAPPIRASAVLGIPRTEVPDVSHWLMLDDPAATNAALDAFLAGIVAR